MTEFVADYPFAAQNADEISFRTGDIVRVTRQVDGGWWEGCVLAADGTRGPVGWFPCSHVHLRQSSGGANHANASPHSRRAVAATTTTAPPSDSMYRGFILKELLDFERDYSEKLTSLKPRFFKPLSKAAWLSEADRDLLIRPLQTLLILQQELLRELNPAALALNDGRDDQACVGQTYVRMAPRIVEATARYAAGAPQWQVRFNELTDTNAELRSFLEQHTTPPTLQQAHQLPLEHTERYGVFLAELERHTPANHPDLPGLKIARACFAQAAQLPKDIYYNKLAEIAMAQAAIAGWYGPALSALGPLQFSGMATALGPDGSATQTVVLLFPERLVVLAADNRRSPASRHTLLVSALLSRILLHGLPLQPNVLVVSAPAAESTPLSVSPARLTLRLELASREQVLTWQAAIQQRVRRSETSNWRATVLNPFAREGRNAAQPEPVAADAAGAYGGDGGRRWLFGRQTRASEAHVPAGAAAAPEEAAAGVGGAPKNLPPEVSEFDVVSAFAKSRPAVPMRAVIKDEPEMAGGSVVGQQHSSGSFGVQVGGGVDHGASIGAASAAAVGKRKTVKVSRDVLDEQNQRLTQAEARLRALQVELDALKSEHQKLHA